MADDQSGGWDSIAREFAATRSAIGSDVVKRWARCLRPGGDIVDIGCGSGMPVSLALANEGLVVFGIDASPTLLSMFRSRLPDAQAACEAVQRSAFFGRKFDGAIAVGLMFLLSENDQQNLIENVGRILLPGARFLFTAPRSPCAWHDLQTGRISRSLGEPRYRQIIASSGMHVVGSYIDEGGNDYLDAMASMA